MCGSLPFEVLLLEDIGLHPRLGIYTDVCLVKEKNAKDGLGVPGMLSVLVSYFALGSSLNFNMQRGVLLFSSPSPSSHPTFQQQIGPIALSLQSQLSGCEVRRTVPCDSRLCVWCLCVRSIQMGSSHEFSFPQHGWHLK